MRIGSESSVQWSSSRRLLDGVPHSANLGSSPYTHPRITVSFPLGTVLVLVIVLTITALFTGCCFFWTKMRRAGRINGLFQRNAIAAAADLPLTSISYGDSVQDSNICSTKASNVPSFPVVMPGDDTPKFIALACPYTPYTPKLCDEAASDELPTSEKPQLKPN